MKLALMMMGMILAAVSSRAAASPEKEAVGAVITAVKKGQDLNSAFPGAISAKEIASLQRVSRCSALNLMKQKRGHYTVVWDCGSKGALGMRVEVTDSKVTSISTMEIGARPNTAQR